MSVRKQTHWSHQEELVLKNAVESLGEIGHWVKISKMIPNKSVSDCYVHWKLLNSLHLDWEASEDARLTELYVQYGEQWFKIADEMSGRKYWECRDRVLELDIELDNNKNMTLVETFSIAERDCLSDVYVKRDENCLIGDWSDEEDGLLLRLHKKYEDDWIKISNGFTERSIPECKIRWQTKFEITNLDHTPLKTKKRKITSLQNIIDSNLLPDEREKLHSSVSPEKENYEIRKVSPMKLSFKKQKSLSVSVITQEKRRASSFGDSVVIKKRKLTEPTSEEEYI